MSKQRQPIWLRNKLSYLLKPVLHPRRFHAYCIGMLKSGTHSLSAIFEDSYNSEHEHGVKELACNTAPGLKTDISIREHTRFIKKRDRKFWLEMESSHILYHSLGILKDEFPDSKFILTIRNCYSWMNSYMNHHLSHDDTDEFWWKLRRMSFKADQLEHHPEEQVLKDRGLYTTDGYLSFWAEYNSSVLEMIPEDRLLVIRTDRIEKDIQEIADFLKIDSSTLNTGKAHSFQARKRYDLILDIDRDFLESKADKYCSGLMKRFFPEIHSVEDSL